MPTVYDFLNGWNVREPFQICFGGKVSREMTLYEVCMYPSDNEDIVPLLERSVTSVDFTTNTIYCEV